MRKNLSIEAIAKVQHLAVFNAKKNFAGEVANYIPELQNVDEDYIASSIITASGQQVCAGDDSSHLFTLQSVSKLILLIGLLEEHGSQQVFSWINAEPSGDHFASLAQIDRFGTVPVNPLINAGAIALCAYIPGDLAERMQWIAFWMQRLLGQRLNINRKVFKSEFKHGDRNRSIAYLMKSTGVLHGNVNDILHTYFSLCAFETNIKTIARLPHILSLEGRLPSGEQIINSETARQVVSIMATCGLYDESGLHLVETGMPAKSGVSGLLVALVPGTAGIACFSPRLNAKGTSLRGHNILRELSKSLHWHFASGQGA